jgi:hypothetical protein
MAGTPWRRCPGGGCPVTPLRPQTLPLATTSPFTPRGRAGGGDTPAWSKAWTQAAQLQQAPSEHIEGTADSSRSSLPAPLLAVPDAKRAIAGFASASSASTCIVAMSRASTSSASTSIASTSGSSTPSAATPSASTASASTASASTLGPSTSGTASSVVSPQAAAPKLASPAGTLPPPTASIPVVPGRSTDAPGDEPVDPPRARSTAPPTEVRAAAPRAPVRVHVDRQEEGCAVWLGVDRGAEHLARQIVGQLASSRPGALPVLAVVCNGTPVYARPRIPKENP